jgi:predicted DNA-binding transcriptional regulator YafY
VREVYPYSLYYYHGCLYLVGQDSLSGEKRTFNLERIRMAELTQKKFQMAEDFDGEAYFEESFGIFKQEQVTVVIDFAESVKPYILERQWHPSQEVSLLKEGGLRLTLKVGGTREVKAWIMGFCEHATVVEPKALRDEIRNDLEKMLEYYVPRIRRDRA